MRRILAVLLLASPVAAARAQDAAPVPAPGDATPGSPAESPPTDPSYRLAPSDYVAVAVYGQPDMSTLQRLDPMGKMRLPLLGDVKLAGQTVGDAENYLEKLYVERELLRSPMVTITVTGFAVREVSVLGAVRSPGNFDFPKETTSLDIVDLITRLGGFTPTAKANAVSVIRRGPDGKETVTTVDVESMISGRSRGNGSAQGFAVYPGDRIWVPERLF